MNNVYALGVAATLAVIAGCAQMQAAQETISGKIDSLGEEVSFTEPSDGATLGREFKVIMAVEGMEIEPAGTVADKTGHHHLLIDAGPVPAGKVIAKSDKSLHFGKGQTETILKLAPGKHTLTLQFGNGNHVSYGEDMSATITVTVR